MQKVIILYTKNTVTMKNFMDENFLLQTETAQKLYHEHAAKMPIIDTERTIKFCCKYGLGCR